MCKHSVLEQSPTPPNVSEGTHAADANRANQELTSSVEATVVKEPVEWTFHYI